MTQKHIIQDWIKWLDEVKEKCCKDRSQTCIWGDNYTKTDRQNKTSIYDNIISSINGSTYGARNEKAIKMYKQQAAMKYATPGILYNGCRRRNVQ